MRKEFIIVSILVCVAIAALGIYICTYSYYLFIPVLPFVFIGYSDLLQKTSSLKRNFPLVARMRYLMETIRPGIQQYFIESDLDGTPFSRTFRSLVYQRSKEEKDTSPFGTLVNVYEEGYEWMNHSLGALNAHNLEHNPRVVIGGNECKKPYACSILNISAMSFGALSKNAIQALSTGAKSGGFAHNTGEGGVSPYHLKGGGDLIWQIGTGYFGCRAKDGGFDAEHFKETASLENVKMIELKLSQGAKPGHGGILPASKNTPEIASIRKVEPGKSVISPPTHRAFSTPIQMMQFIGQLRELSGGKPVGFKLCIGNKKEVFALCKAMAKTGIKPDFITVDGSEGGTGAAPIEFANSVGMPMREAVAFMHDALTGFGFRKDIKIIVAGKIVTGFHIFRALSLGGDICYSARGMMMALGCIQARVCNHNDCPVGVTTHKPHLVQGLNPENKSWRVKNYHANTVESFVELMAAAGLDHPEKVDRSHVYRRLNAYEIHQYDEIYPEIPEGCLLTDNYDGEYKEFLSAASADSFA